MASDGNEWGRADDTVDAVLERAVGRLLARSSHEYAVVIDETVHVHWASPSAHSVLGWASGDIHLGLPGLHPDDRARAVERLPQMLSGEVAQPLLTRMRHRDGSYRWCESVYLGPVAVSGGARAAAIRGHVLLVRDVTERVELEHRARRRVERELTLVAGRSEYTVATWPDGSSWVSPSLRQLLGLAEDTDLGLAAVELVHPDDRALRERTFGRLRRGEIDEARGQVRLRGERGYQWFDLTARIVDLDDEDVLVGWFRDVTDRVAAEATVEHVRRHDDLTGLLNRRELLRLVDGRPGTVLAIADLDRFRYINEAFGGDAGDSVLAGLAARFRVGSETWTVARLGSDQFAVSDSSGEPADDIAQRLFDAVHRPVEIVGGTVQVTISIGVAESGLTGLPGEELLERAIEALDAAKEKGRATAHRFDAHAAAVLVRRRRLSASLAEHVRAGRVVPYFQPEVDLRDGRLVGAEALARLLDPELGVVPASDFIPLAERAGLAGVLTEQIVNEAVRLTAGWDRDGRLPAEFRVRVNVDGRRFNQPGFVREVFDLLADAGLAADRLCLELTETTLVADPDVAARSIAELVAAGITVELDDFGTGWSSLQWLSHFPVTGLKVDRGFVVDLATGSRSRALAGAVVDLGHRLGLSVTAEGIETSAQAERLLELGCLQGQGWLYAPALAADVFSLRLP